MANPDISNLAFVNYDNCNQTIYKFTCQNINNVPKSCAKLNLIIEQRYQGEVPYLSDYCVKLFWKTKNNFVVWSLTNMTALEPGVLYFISLKMEHTIKTVTK